MNNWNTYKIEIAFECPPENKDEVIQAFRRIFDNDGPDAWLASTLRVSAKNYIITEVNEVERCHRCGAPVVFERKSDDMPHEYDVCEVCERHICPDCLDWAKSGDEGMICIDCGGE